MKFVLTGHEVSSEEKSSLFILDSCNSTNGSYHFPPPSPSYRAPEMAVIPENRISTCSRSSSNSGDHRQPYPQTQSYPQTQPMAINVNVNVGTYPQRLSSHSLSEPSRQSYDSRQSYHSNSSSSIGSLDILDETGFSSNVNVAELYRRGMSDADIIYTWLSDLRFDIYFENFLQAGYDMPTISRMTPEDLTAIGITKPIHRKKLKREISKLNIGDGIPDFMPSSVLEWLQCLGLDIYYETLQSQQYDTIDSIIKISWEDLEDIGINLLGHQKKILLAVNRLKKFNKRQSQTSSRDSTPVTGTMPRWSADMAANSGYAINGQVPYRSHSGENVSSQVRECSPYSMAASNSLKEIMNHRSRSRHVSGGEVVPIMTKSGMSRSSSGNSVNSSTDFGLPRCQSFGQAERDSTPPSSEDSGSSYGGSMQRKSSNKGPMKGIHGLTMSKHSSQDSIDQQFRNSMDNQVAQYATLRRTNSRKQSSQSIELQQFGVLPPSPISKTGSSTSPGLGSLPSPFANFRSPYAQIQSGEIKNQLSKGENRSSSVPSSPVTKGATLSNDVNIKAKKPPAPPKRTMSIKRNSDEQVNCEVNEDEETPEFPPPPPPIAFNLQAMKTNQPKNGTRTNEHVAERRTSPFREGLKLQNVIESSLAARRRASSAEKEARNCNSNNNNEMDITPTNQCNSRITDRSNSATPRNSIENIPFANDNAGTIKQKFGQPPLTTGGNADCIEDNLDDALESEDNEDGEFDFDTVKRMPKPVMHVQPVYNEQNHIKLVSEQPKNVMGNDKIQRDVLNDIGCMLENLSSELDAMLDTETGSNN